MVMRSGVATALWVMLGWGAAWALSSVVGGGPAGIESTVFWLPTAVALGTAIAVAGWRLPWVLGGAAAAAAVAALFDGRGAGAALGFAVIEAGSVGAAAWIGRASRDAADPRFAWGGQVTAALVVAAVGATAALPLWGAIAPGASLAAEWRAWAVSGFVGALLAVPPIVGLSGFRAKRSGGMGTRAFLAGAAAFAAFVACAAWVFQADVSDRFGGSIGPTLAYLPLAPLVAASVLWGSRGGPLAIAAGALLVIGWTATGHGPFAELEGFAGEAMLEVQGYVAVAALLAGWMVAQQAALASALEQAKDWQVRYRQVLDGTGTVAVTLDAPTGACRWGEGGAALPGGAPPHVRAWIARAEPADQPLMLAEWDALVKGRQGSATWRWPDAQARLAAVRGPDGEIELVTGLVQRGQAGG
jgi:hypothetical protein